MIGKIHNPTIRQKRVLSFAGTFFAKFQFIEQFEYVKTTVFIRRDTRPRVSAVGTAIITPTSDLSGSLSILHRTLGSPSGRGKGCVQIW